MTRGKAVKLARSREAVEEAEMFHSFNSYRSKKASRSSFLPSPDKALLGENVVKSEDSVVFKEEGNFYDENDLTFYEDVYDEDDMASYDSDDVFALDQMMDSSPSDQTESSLEFGH